MRKYFLWAAVALAALIATPLVVAAFLPRTFVIEREIVINRPKADVFDYLRCVKNQEHYSMWAQIDPVMKKTFRGTDGEVGSVFAWESNDPNVGIGEQEIVAIRDGERVDFLIRFTKPFQSTDPMSMTTDVAGDAQTRVKSVYHGKMNYPFNLCCSMICNTVGQGMETTLGNLKALLENPAEAAGNTR
jgi:hypothetical protein